MRRAMVIAAAPMTEHQLYSAIVALCEQLHIFVFHTDQSRFDLISDPGFPDLVLAGTRGVLFAELKQAGGRVSRDQIAWKWRLRSAGARWELWRPRDLLSGRIEENLRAIA